MKFRSLCAAGFLASCLFASVSGLTNVPAASAQEAAEREDVEAVALRFGIRASVLDISLSPSGTKIAWITPGPNHTEILRVFDLDGEGSFESILSNTEITADLNRCDWVTDERLICEVFGMTKRSDGLLLPYTRMFALNADGNNMEQVVNRSARRQVGFNQDGGDIVAFDVASQPGEILITRNNLRESRSMTRTTGRKEGLAVDRLNVLTMEREMLVRPDARASRYIADERGEVRFKVRDLVDNRGRLTGERVMMYREPGEERWIELEEVTLDGEVIESFGPISINAAKNSLYAYRTIDGFSAIIEIPLEGSKEAQIVASRDDVDVGRLIRIGRQRRVVGVSYATEKPMVEYFDEELADLSRALGEALPNKPLVNIVGASSDESRLLIIASSDTEPGTVYLFEKATWQLEPLLNMRDYLVEQTMGEMQPVTYPASDGTQIPGYLTLPPGSDGKNLPAIVLPHGGPAARDYWGFDWIVQFFTARGYAVLQPNYRGSSGYGEAWFGRNGYQAWDVAIGDVIDAGRWLISEGVANPDQIAIVGWSYGGYAALQSQVVDPELFKAVVAIAPVTDLEFLRSASRNYTNFRLRDEQLGDGPHIAAGSPRRHAERFLAPVALFHGTRDINVTVRHSQEMAEALEDEGKPVTYVEFEDLQHDLGDNKARSDMLAEIDRFLNVALGR